jgi:transcriptional regulator with XRE-family HTH domain
MQELPIGRRLKVERVAAGISLNDMASALGVSAGHLSNIEAGKRAASDDVVSRIRLVIRGRAAA